ncbi:MAG: phosphatidate cytidylyltransferase [Chloroflexi bacterium]|nr:phosphatidate cytidylyltransferase [Chloroflexota bacterium]
MQRPKSTTSATTTAGRSALSNMGQRFVFGLIWLVVALTCLAWGEWPWTIFVAFGAMVGVVEFCALAHGRPIEGVAWVGAPAAAVIVVGFELGETAVVVGALVAAAVGALIGARFLQRTSGAALMTILGLVYVAVPLGITVLLRRELGVFGVLLALMITAGSDTFAYFGGRMFGRTPLAPRISPKKTVEGMVIGLVGGAVLAAAVLAMAGGLTLSSLIIPLLGPPLAVIGDLLESALKRYFDVKDSHLPRFNVIPGHGGVLDRTDSLLLVAPFLAIVLTIIGML